MKKQSFDENWEFTLLSPSNTKVTGYKLNLPHDYSIIQQRDKNCPSGNSNGFFPGGLGTYTKKFKADDNWIGKEIVIEFEGIYMNATISVNYHIVARHPYGYTSFHCNITPYLYFDRENIITVSVNNTAMPNTRWYSGSGIYRHVWLLVGDDLHIAPWGIFASSPYVSEGKSIVCVKTTIESKSHAEVKVKSSLLDHNGNIVSSDKLGVECGNGAKEIEQNLVVSPAHLWSVQDPYLYKLKSEVIKNNIVIDCVETNIGIRKISFDARNGFRLNDKTLKLKGGCVHHDCGILGAAAYDRAEERKIELLKQSGFNAVRCAHNPPSPAFLDACDRLGMLVIDEAFDCWKMYKTINDYSNFFEDWWQKDMSSMVLRDRNHPSIILWSTGNEIGEKYGRSNGYKYSQMLANFVRGLDGTRGITNALDDLWADPYLNLVTNSEVKPEDYLQLFGELTHEFAKSLDVVGYNYLLHRYEYDGQKYPDRIICGTETFAKEADLYWNAVEKFPYVIGDFVWTSLDYLGEAGIGHIWPEDSVNHGSLSSYPWHQAFCGDIDICGFKRPQSYFRDCVWGILETPYIAVHNPGKYGVKDGMTRWAWPEVINSWTWAGYEGKPVIVDVYSTQDEIELILNGISIGKKPAGKNNRFTASFEFTYQPGTLEAVAYKNGVKTSGSTLKTASQPVQIRLSADREILKAEYGDLCYVTVELIDKDNNLVMNDERSIYFTAYGEGDLIAVGNSDPKSEEMYTGNTRKTHHGRAMTVLRANGGKGEITLTAMANDLPVSVRTIKVK